MHKFEAALLSCKFLVHWNYCGVRYTKISPPETETLMRLTSMSSNSTESSAKPARGLCFPGIFA